MLKTLIFGTCTRDLCFGSEIRKNVLPLTPQFYYKIRVQWGYMYFSWTFYRFTAWKQWSISKIDCIQGNSAGAIWACGMVQIPWKEIGDGQQVNKKNKI